MNVIDSLIVTLSLDPSEYKKGSVEADALQKKMGEQATKTGKDFEAAGKKGAESFTKITRAVILMFGAFTAGRGIKEFISDITTSDSAIGRMAYVLDTATRALSTWQGVARATGGSAQGITGSLGNLEEQLQTFALTGESSVIPYLRALDIGLQNADGTFKNSSQLLDDLANSATLKGLDPARANAILKGLGIDQATASIILRGGDALRRYKADVTAAGVVTDKQALAAQQLQYSWGILGEASTTLGRTILTQLTPAIVWINRKLIELSEWFQAHPVAMEAAFAALVVVLGALSAAALAAAVSFLALSLPILAIVAAIGLVIAIIAILYANWTALTEGLKSRFAEFWQYFADKWASISVPPGLLAIGNAFRDTFNVIKDGLKLVHDLFFGTGNDIRVAWTQLGKDILTAFVDLPAEFAKIWTAVGEGLVTIIGSALDLAIGAVKNRVNAVWQAIFHKDLFAAPSAPPGIDDQIADLQAQRTQAVKESIGGPADRARIANLDDRIAALQKQKIAAPAVGATQAAPKPGAAPAVGATQAAPKPGIEYDAQAQQDIADFQSRGWTKAQATGIVANLQRESYGRIGAIGDKGQAYGLAQWHPDRQADLAKFAGTAATNTTREQQLAFVDYELRQGTEQPAGAALAKASTPEQAAVVVSNQYERPKDAIGEARVRAQIATNLAAASTYTPPPATTGIPPSAATVLRPAIPIESAAVPGASSPTSEDVTANRTAPTGENAQPSGFWASLGAAFARAPARETDLAFGAPTAAAASNIANDNRVNTRTSSNQVSIGTMHVNAPLATDASGIARDMQPALVRSAAAANANSGQS